MPVITKYFFNLPLVLLVLLFHLTGVSKQISAREFSPAASSDAKSNISFLENLLAKHASRFQLLEGDLFEAKKRYDAYAPSNMLSTIKHIQKKPDNPTFQNELKLLQKHLAKGPLARSVLFIQTAFNVPGNESFTVKLRQPVALHGRLISISLWVHSQNYPHSLKLLFLNRQGRSIAINAGRLLWEGWRRLRLDLPAGFFDNTNRLIQSRKKHQFVGFRLFSPRGGWAKSKYVSIMLDNLLVLSDTTDNRHPGSEIEDF